MFPLSPETEFCLWSRHSRCTNPQGEYHFVLSFSKLFIHFRVPNSLEGHDTPEVEIFGMAGVPVEDLQRHYSGQPVVPYKRIKVSEGGLLPLLAAQKASVPDGPDLSPTAYVPPTLGTTSPTMTVTVSPPIRYTVPLAAQPVIYHPQSRPIPVVTSRSFDNIVVPPSMDASGRLLPGSIIVAPDLLVSVVQTL